MYLLADVLPWGFNEAPAKNGGESRYTTALSLTPSLASMRPPRKTGGNGTTAAAQRVVDN